MTRRQIDLLFDACLADERERRKARLIDVNAAMAATQDKKGVAAFKKLLKDLD